MVSVVRSHQFLRLSKSQSADAYFLAVLSHNIFYAHKINIIYIRCAFTKSVPNLDAEIPQEAIVAITLYWLTTATSFD